MIKIWYLDLKGLNVFFANVIFKFYKRVKIYKIGHL